VHRPAAHPCCEHFPELLERASSRHQGALKRQDRERDISIPEMGTLQSAGISPGLVQGTLRSVSATGCRTLVGPEGYGCRSGATSCGLRSTPDASRSSQATARIAMGHIDFVARQPAASRRMVLRTICIVVCYKCRRFELGLAIRTHEPTCCVSSPIRLASCEILSKTSRMRQQ
jgi:hypothetical protein